MEDFVFVEKQPYLFPCDNGRMNCDIIVQPQNFDLGMRTRGSLKRQLDVDIPRGEFLVSGKIVDTASEILKRACNPRACTQAVFAPPVEWLIRHGYVAVEPKDSFQHSYPMRVDVDDAGEVRVTKRLALRSWDMTSSYSDVEVSVYVNRDAIVVGFHSV